MYLNEKYDALNLWHLFNLSTWIFQLKQNNNNQMKIFSPQVYGSFLRVDDTYVTAKMNPHRDTQSSVQSRSPGERANQAVSKRQSTTKEYRVARETITIVPWNEEDNTTAYGASALFQLLPLFIPRAYAHSRDS